jgi:hypothetical protein
LVDPVDAIVFRYPPVPQQAEHPVRTAAISGFAYVPLTAATGMRPRLHR